MAAEWLEGAPSTGDNFSGGSDNDSAQISLASITELQGVHQNIQRVDAKPDSGTTPGPGSGDAQADSFDAAAVRSSLIALYKKDALATGFNPDFANYEAEGFNDVSDQQLKEIVSFVDKFKQDRQASYVQFDKMVEHYQCDPHLLEQMLGIATWEMIRQGLLDCKTQNGYSVDGTPREYLGDGKWGPGSWGIYYSDFSKDKNAPSQVVHEIPAEGCG